VQVLRGDAVGELVQVRLPNVAVPGGFEQPHRLGALRRHVLGENSRAVGRANACRVEEILDRQPDPVARRQLRDEDPALGQG
jgi:hypothetical protein